MACRRRRPRKVPTRSGPLRECSQKSSSSQRTSKPRRSHGLYPDAARDVHNCPTPAEEAISTAEPSGHGKVAAWVYSEAFVPEDEVLLRARERASELGCPAVLPGVGAVLRVLAAATKAHAVVEVGTGAGVAALWLLRGMPYDGQLTTIDREVEHQRAARAAFAEDGVAPQRTRIIPGRPGDVLPRLADGAYDLVLVASDPLGYPEYVEEALRLLRPGGVLAIDGALLRDRVADPARRDELTTVVREVGRTLRNDERVLPAMLPSGDGLLLAVRR